MIAAIIPARGGSKRIPRKNIKSFQGEPIIAYSIRAAQQTGLFDSILISTDCDEIADIGRALGAGVPFKRPAELADDHTPIDEVLMHAITELEARAQKPDYFCCISATAPLLEARLLREGYEAIVASGAATAVSVTPYPSPILRAFSIDESGRLHMKWPEHRYTRSQDLAPAFHDAGQFYWADTAKYLAEKKLFGSDAVGVVLPRHRVLDIDTPEDWVMAENLYTALKTRTDEAT